MLALLQGVGDLGCHNVTISTEKADNYTGIFYFNETVLEAVPLKGLFTVSVYFFIVFVYLCFCLVSFIWLNKILKSKHGKKNYKINDIDENESEASLLKNKTLDITATTVINDKKETNKKHVRLEKSILFLINFLATFFVYGILSGLQSVK